LVGTFVIKKFALLLFFWSKTHLKNSPKEASPFSRVNGFTVAKWESLFSPHTSSLGLSGWFKTPVGNFPQVHGRIYLVSFCPSFPLFSVVYSGLCLPLYKVWLALSGVLSPPHCASPFMAPSFFFLPPPNFQTPMIRFFEAWRACKPHHSN